MAELEVRDLTVEFSSGDLVVRPLSELWLQAEDGELVVVLGPSGCGKTTLLSCLAGILTPTSGSISFGGQEVSSLSGRAMAQYRRSTVGVVFQAFNLIPSLSARANVIAPLRLAKLGRREAAARADELLATVGLSDRANYRPGQLSGGQQQRVAIARALVHRPPLVLADEPTAHLDHIQVEGVLRLVRELAAPGRLVIVSTHDDRVTRLADRVIELVGKQDARHHVVETLQIAAGEVVFSQGDRGDLIYTVDEGEIEIYQVEGGGSEHHLAVVKAGDYFGELGPILGLPRSASARARTPCVLTRYSVQAFRRTFGDRGLTPGRALDQDHALVGDGTSGQSRR